MPELLHGSTNTGYTQRRTILLWYTGVRDDLEYLEFIKTETLSTVPQYYSDRLSMKASGPSGFVNNNG